jgi:Zn-dependent M28 family amino/carboxypeptidase
MKPETPSFAEVAGAIVVAGQKSRHAAETLQSLTSEVGPRLAGSANDARAVAWAKKTMEAAGLANVHTEPVTVPHWERGEASVSILGASKKPIDAVALDAVALGGSVATPEKGVQAEIVEVESIEALEKLPKDAARGKVVFFNKRMRKTKTGEGYGEVVEARFAGPMRASAHGALAVVIRSTGTDDSTPHTGAIGHDPKIAEIPAAALSGTSADALHDALQRSKNARLDIRLTSKMLANVPSANVVGEVPGRDGSGELVLLGAHLDSWDLATGAFDDGAGCAIVLEAARLVLEAPLRPRRTTRVVFFASEEYGNIPGAHAYAKAHEDEAAKHVLAMEADLGGDRAYALLFLGAPDKRTRALALGVPLKSLGIEPGERDAFAGADISPLRKLGVPVILLAQDATRYFDVHHTKNDTFERVDAEALAQVATAHAVVAWGAAEMDGDFGRVPEEKRETKW